MHEYKVKGLKVVDGDTADVDIDLGFGVWLRKQRIRLLGIDTPESRTRDLEEKKYGLIAKEFLKGYIFESEDTVRLRTSKDKKGKFGRILGEFIVIQNEGQPDEVDINVNQLMIEKHHAVKYYGQSKDDIAEQHIIYRELVNANGN